MKVEKIPVLEIDILSKIMKDYISENPKVADLYKYKININSFEKIMFDKSKQKLDRGVLTSELLKQYSEIEYNELVIKNIELINKSNTFTITTAHQLCLFTGPMYFIYKILSAIKLCKILKEKYPHNNFVPIYWMGSEDHDFDEINHLNIFDKKVVWENSEKGAVGKMSNKDIIKNIKEISKLLFNDKDNEFIEKLNIIFNDDKNYSKSFFEFVHLLFGKYGLVILEQDNSEFKKLFKNQIEEELFDGLVVNNIQKNINYIDAHYKLQAKPRDINLFYMIDGLRERIIQEKEYFIVNNTEIKFDKKSLLIELNNHPERFSPNVLLRPLYQECILPNLAYIGGGGEIAYWLQLQDVFDSQQTNFPMLLLRDMGLLIPPNVSKIIKKISFDKKSLFLNKDLLISNLIKFSSSNNLGVEIEINILDKMYKLLLEKAVNIDKSLEGSVLAEQKKTLNSLHKIEGKMLKAEKQNNELLVQRITKIKDKLFPNNKLQERHDNFLQYFFNPNEDLFKLLLENFNPLKSEMKIIELE